MNEDPKRIVNGLTEPLVADKVSGLSATVFLLSPIPEAIALNDELNPIVFGRYALTTDTQTEKTAEWIDSAMHERESVRFLKLIEKEGIGFLQRIVDTITAEADALQGAVFKVTDAIGNDSDDELIVSYDRMMRAYIHCYGWGCITFVYEAIISEWLSESIGKKFENATEIIGALLKNEYVSFMVESERYLRRIAKATGEEREALVAAYQKQFYYMNANYVSAPLMTREHIEEKLHGLHDMHTEMHQEVDGSAILQSLDPRDARIVSALKLSEAIRDIRKRANLIGSWGMARFMDEAMLRSGWSKKDAYKLTWYELPLLLNDPQEASRRIAARNEYTLLVDNGRKYYSDGVWLRPKAATDSAVSEIKGTPASKGIVQGRTRLVLGPDSFGDLEKGEILIAEMTRPDYLSVMNRAVAFVTDEGGLTCHAAIVAREMRKPCVVGTKIATQVFKDGDLVEVDANTGVVRIIERHG